MNFRRGWRGFKATASPQCRAFQVAYQVVKKSTFRCQRWSRKWHGRLTVFKVTYLLAVSSCRYWFAFSGGRAIPSFQASSGGCSSTSNYVVLVFRISSIRLVSKGVFEHVVDIANRVWTAKQSCSNFFEKCFWGKRCCVLNKQDSDLSFGEPRFRILNVLCVAYQASEYWIGRVGSAAFFYPCIIKSKLLLTMLFFQQTLWNTYVLTCGE